MIGESGEGQIVIMLPRLGGTRADADQLLDDAGLPEAAPAGARVILVGSDVMAASTSFADQLVKRLLQERTDLSVVMVAPPKRLRTQMASSGAKRGIQKSRMLVSTAAAALG